jgi:hypothetical protein
MSMYNPRGGKDRIMATAQAEPRTESIPMASDEEAMAALDYTSRHYLNLSAEEFIARWDSGQISARDRERTPGLGCVLDMLAFLRC